MGDVIVRAISRSFDLKEQRWTSFLTLEVAGKTVSVRVEDTTELEGVLGELSRAPSPRESPAVTAPNAPPEELVDWRQLPDEVLNRRLKRAFEVLEVVDQLSYAQIRALAEDILSRFSDEEWKSVDATFAPASAAEEIPRPSLQPEPSPASPAPTPNAVGVVTWVDGTPIFPEQGRPARTVPRDEYGYPVVSSGDVDPRSQYGRAEEVDEDGVGQF